MCWLYFGHDYDIAVTLMEKYKKHGFKVIGASVAKCSEGVNPLYLDMPNFEERIANIDMWAGISKRFDIEGIVTTAWSNYTGTIAPPHPFFDTIWYPVVFSAQKYWNAESENEKFEEVFMRNYFGVKGFSGSLKNNNSITFQNFQEVCGQSERHQYVAGVYKIMSLVSAYRIKSLAVARELYKLFSDTTVCEKNIVAKRYHEVNNMREYIKPRVKQIVGSYYNENNAEEFINSRLMIDEQLYDRLMTSCIGNIQYGEGLK